jgi:hypothetical protein
MWALAAKALAYVAGAALVLGGIYYGIDSVVGAFRDRTALQAKVEQQSREAAQLQQDVTQARNEAEQSRQDALKAAKAASDEIALRDRLAKEAQAREAKNAKELKDAKHRLDEWKRTATDDLRRCLDLRVPDDDDGLRPVQGDEAGPGAAVHADDPHRVPDATGV